MTVPAVRFHGKEEKERPFACSRELQHKVLLIWVTSCFDYSGHAVFVENKDALNKGLLPFLEQQKPLVVHYV